MKNLTRLIDLQSHDVYGQPVLFPSDALDKKEDLKDVCGYLNNWADIIIIRHKNIQLIEEFAKYSEVPVINAMSDINHPCEILSDMYSLSKIRELFVLRKKWKHWPDLERGVQRNGICTVTMLRHWL